jgi:hypothetical protein
MATGFGDRHNCRVARVFFDAATKVSTDSEDILPQEGGPEGDHSVFHVFSLLFPEVVGGNLAAGVWCFPAVLRVHLHVAVVGGN